MPRKKSSGTKVALTKKKPAKRTTARKAIPKARAKPASKKATAGKKLRRAVKKAGPATLKLKPSKAAKRIVARRGKLRARLRIVYTPTGGSPKAVTRTITLKRAAKR